MNNYDYGSLTTKCQSFGIIFNKIEIVSIAIDKWTFVMRLTVNKISKYANYSNLVFTDNKTVKLDPYINVKEGDILEFTPSFEKFKSIKKIIQDPDSKVTRKVKVFPSYRKIETISVPPHKFKIIFRERYSNKDWKTVKNLEQFHYRGKEFNKIVGKRTVLLAELENYGVIGFGMLSGATAAVGPRFKFLETNFGDQMRTKLINRIVRIPRVVIHPEFRGMGLGVLMTKHLIKYCQQYWEVNQYSPHIIEVIAAMTDYHRFFEEAGFVNIDRTLGYGGSAVKPNYGNGSFEFRKKKKSYDFMKDQKSKPYLVYPINKKYKKKLSYMEKGNKFEVLKKKPQLREQILFESINVQYKSKKNESERCNIIRTAFGIENGNINSNVLPNFSLSVEPGDVVLITGASGSGKSTIIRLLTSNFNQITSDMEYDGKLPKIQEENIAVLDSNLYLPIPLIEQIETHGTLEDAIKLLNSVGLSEAHLYLKDPSQISDGQRYRFAIAKLCDSKKPIWVADEFVSSLNPEMAAIVAKGLRKISSLYGATLFLAAPHIDNFSGSLVPNKLVIVQWGRDARIYSIKTELEQNEKSVEFNLSNNGQMPLSQIQIGFTNSKGKFFIKKVIKELKPTETVQLGISLKYARDINTIDVKTHEGVGEIYYSK